VIKLSLIFTFVELNSKKDSLWVSKYGVNAYPTVVLFKSDGEEIDRIVGYASPREFLKTVKSYLKGKGTLADLERKLETDPSNLDLLSQVGEKYMDRSKYKEALMYYQNIVSLDPKNKRGKTDKALYKIGVIYRKQKNYQIAIDKFRELIQIFPESSYRLDAEEYIPYIYALMGDTTNAFKFYQKILDDYPDLEEKEKEWVEKQIKKLKGEEE
jgi:tetratricopeptide (TPR) repeat protein